MTIPLLDLTPTGYPSPRYRFATSYPWVKALPAVRATMREAYEDATSWAEGYRSADPLGNMAAVLGVAKHGGGYVGVVNYYRSNT